MSFTALSIMNPWPWLILRPDVAGAEAREELRRRRLIKDCENREGWETPQRGWVLLHASSHRIAKWDYQAATMFAAKRGVELPLVAMAYGAVVGAMRVDDCRRGYESPWAVAGANHFVIGAAVPFARAVKCDGKPRFFQLPVERQGALGEQLARELAGAVHAAGLAKCFSLEPGVLPTNHTNKHE